MRNNGDHDQALATTDQIRHDYSRVPTIMALLPVPHQVRVTVPGMGLPPDLTVRIDGKTLPYLAANTGDAPTAVTIFARLPGRNTSIEASATGYAVARMVLPSNASATPIELVLRPAPVWQLQVGPGNDAWVRLQTVTDGVMLRRPDGILRLRPSDGSVIATAPRGQYAPFSRGDLGVINQRLMIPRTDGSVLAFPTDLSVPGEVLMKVDGAVTTLIDTEFTLRPGHRLQAVVEDFGTRQQITALEGRSTIWTYTAVVGDRPVCLLRHDDRLIAIDDTNIHMIEEDGRGAGVFALPALRLGPVLSLPPLGDRYQVMIPTASGPVRVAFGNHLQPVMSLADAALAGLGAATVTAEDDHSFLIQGRQNLDLLEVDVRSRRVWRQAAEPTAFPPTLGPAMVVSATTTGDLIVRDRSTGRVIRRIVHGTPLATAPLIFNDIIVVVDQKGLVAAYR